MKFENFLADMGERPAGMTLDRIDSTKGYTKGNCRWADNYAQSRNRRNIGLRTAFGQDRPLWDWAAKYGIQQGTIRARLRSGMTLEQALTTPLRVDKSHPKR